MLRNVYSFFHATSTVLDSVIKVLVGVIVIGMSVSIIAQVFFRYIVGASLSWPEEITVMLMAWVTFLGGSMGVWRSSHINVDLIIKQLPRKGYQLMMLFIHVLILFFCLYLLEESYRFALNSAQFRSDGLRIPLMYPRLCVPFGITVMCIHSTTLVLQDCLALFEKEQKE